ncbi:AAA family ATPase [Anaerolineales bacterium HSG25]|nr:AAA family ATPase [Anaerolineales bacterium HSG25]
MIKFPYGNADFYKIITQNYFYVDRTNKIELLEDAGDVLLFLRPRRFGKSLLLSMLENYYDVNKADEFERLFGHLAIGQDPTPLHNQYLILKWNFSEIDAQGDVEEIKQALHDHINGSIKDFVSRYQTLLSYQVEINPTNAVASLASILTAVNMTPYKIYLLIDEYDNFANEVLMAGQSSSQTRYETLIQGEGMLKILFKVVKSGTEGRGIDRVFITGVSPVVMSDMTSGFNIATNIYLEPDFNDMCGFWEHEVAEALQQIATKCQFSTEQVDEALHMMRTFYNGYSFTYETEPLIYNPTLSIYFMRSFQRHCKYPRQMLDHNMAMDRNKIAYVSQLPYGETVISQALNDTDSLVISALADRFGVKEMLRQSHDRTFMVSLLYYFGVLTLSESLTAQGKLILHIPNLVIRKLYVERIQEMLLPGFTIRDEAERVVEHFYQSGDIQPLCDFMTQKYFKVFDNRDYRWANELTIKTAFLTMLFNDTFYIMDSETSLQRDYADLTMIIRPDMRRFQLLDFLLEFKYIELGKHNLTGEQVRAMSVEELNALKLVKQALKDSKTKLTRYRTTLQSTYGSKLRLRTYSVVAVGFDRLVWIEI